MTYQVEVTDTFGGEANYCWLNRYSIEPRKSTDRAIVRAAKKAAGWSGMRCHVSSFGDSIEVRPVGRNHPLWVMFINYAE
jgi:hypothetical protein